MIIPTGNAPHKSTQTPFELRFKLAQAAFVDCGSFCEPKISDIENNSRISYTVDTLRELHALHPDSELFLIVGSDMNENLPKWKNYEEIKNLCTFVAGERDGKSSTQIREMFKPKRYIHSINVAIMCYELSKKHGLSSLDSEKAYIAGILHDITKKSELKPNSVLFEPSASELETPKLWHALTGAELVRDEMGITDPDIINAIRYHTIGRMGMSVVEKIVYIADKISAERDYKGVEYLRALAFENLDAAVDTEMKEKKKKYER
jgi:nicotinate-nucleotide adenylyltransferase